MTWNLGSVAQEILLLVENVPTAISGIPLLRIADRNRETVQTYTGTEIGSQSINIKFQNAILYLSISDTSKLMMAVGTDTFRIKIGDFSEQKGGESNIKAMAENFRQMGFDELKNLGGSSTYYKARG